MQIKAVIIVRIVRSQLNALRHGVAFSKGAVEIGRYWGKVVRVGVPAVVGSRDEEGAGIELGIVIVFGAGDVAAVFASGGTDGGEGWRG